MVHQQFFISNLRDSGVNVPRVSIVWKYIYPISMNPTTISHELSHSYHEIQCHRVSTRFRSRPCKVIVEDILWEPAYQPGAPKSASSDQNLLTFQNWVGH